MILFRTIILCFILLLPLALRGGERVVIAAGTPVFARPDAEAELLLITAKAVDIEYWSVRSVFYVHHPLARYHEFYEVRLSPGKTGWACPEFKASVKPGGGVDLSFTPISKSWNWYLAIIAVTGGLLLILSLWFWSRYKKFKFLNDVVMSISFLVLLRWLLLLILLCGSKNIITAASDDPGYFQTALGMLNGDFSGQWRFTIGLGILYLPFILLLNAKEFYDIAVPFANFSGFVLMPACLAICYLIIRKLTGSQTKGFIAALLWTVMPVFYTHFEFWDEKVFKSFFALPQVTQCFRLYRNFITMGYNAMSDTPSTFFVLLTIMLCLLLPVRIRSIALVAGCYSFACLLRINNILFTPLIAWLLWQRFKDDLLLSPRYFAKALATALLSFIVVFAPQFIVNKLHFGSIFTFPYILHGKANDGFEWSAFADGVQYLSGSNLAYWALGTAGLIFITDRKLQITLILWAMPVILFFMGYTYTCCDSHRFIMSTYAAMFGGLVSAEIWNKCSRSEFIRLCLVLGLSLLLVCPSAYYWERQLPWDLQQYAYGAAIANCCNWGVPVIALAIALSLYRNLYVLSFALVFIILYFLYNPYVYPVVFVLLLLYALKLAGGEVYHSITNTKSARVKN